MSPFICNSKTCKNLPEVLYIRIGAAFGEEDKENNGKEPEGSYEVSPVLSVLTCEVCNRCMHLVMIH